GLEKEQILEAVSIIGKASKGIMMWAMGLTHHTHGVDNILALGNIALARGWLGKEGVGLMPIRGHSNVQGVGSMGVSPQLKKAFETKLEALYNIQIPKSEGQDTFSSMKAAEEGQIQVAFLLGGNLYSSNPDSSWAKKAMRNIPLTITVSTKLNEGHFHGRGKTALILPALARDEEPQTTTQESMFNFIRLSEGGEPSVLGEMRSEVEILAELASIILNQSNSPPFDWSKLSSHQTLREAIAQVVPGFEEMSKMEKRGDPKNTEFEVKGRRFETQSIPTLDHKAHFQVTPLPEFSTEEFPPNRPFRLMTLRSEGQFNTVVYDEEDLYRGNLKRNVVMMAEKDVQALGLEEGQRVQVETSVGKMDVSVSVIEIAQGCLAMYYPEANLLVPQSLDKRSKTPGFKCVAAGIKKL
ncbi:MAG: molybdopterin-dependent oxidoreductase, partial [Cyanobacteria bacterium]|nr:molybdopterin-dependent oxidoreductase [Cyanobacteriota bacterium]